jgi:hypothetical protein
MNIVDRIKRSIANQNADVFIRADFMNFGSQAQVGRALAELQNNGALVKFGITNRPDEPSDDMNSAARRLASSSR